MLRGQGLDWISFQFLAAQSGFISPFMQGEQSHKQPFPLWISSVMCSSLSVCRRPWSPVLPSCSERAPCFLLSLLPSSSQTTTDWSTPRPAPPASPATPPPHTLRVLALWPRPPVTQRTLSRSYRTAACDWQAVQPITVQRPWAQSARPALPFRINFFIFLFFQIQTVPSRNVRRQSHWRV